MLSVLFGSEKISCQLQRVIEVDKLSVVNICTCTLMVEFAEIDICTLTIMHRFTSLNFRKSEYTTVFSFDRYQLILSWDSAITDP